MNSAPIARLITALTALFTSGAFGVGCVAEPLDDSEALEALGDAAQAFWANGGEIRSGVASDRCLEVAGAVAADGVGVQINPCNGTAAQKWTRKSNGSIQSMLDPSYCLDVASDTAANGTSMLLGSCDNTRTAQRWELTPRGQLRSFLRDGCVDVGDAAAGSGTGAQIGQCSGAKGQQWFEIPSLPVTDADHAITIHDVVVNGSGNSGNARVAVSPGAMLQAQIKFTIEPSPSCPSCTHYVKLGLQGKCGYKKIVTLYAGVPGPTGTSKTVTVGLPMPEIPSVYYLRFNGSTDLESAASDPGEANNIAVITVAN